MAENGHTNGSKYHILASNALVVEILRFGFWLVLFLWVLSSINFRISNNEKSTKANSDGIKNNRRHIRRIDSQLDLKPFPEEVEHE